MGGRIQLVKKMNLRTSIKKLFSPSTLAALTLGLLITSVARASTVKYSDASGTVYNNASGTLHLQQFDGSLGTLTGISIFETITVNGSATVTAPGSGSNLYVNAATLKNKGTITGVGLSAYSATAQSDFISDTTTFSHNEQQVYLLPSATGMKTSAISSGHLGDYTGVGNVAFDYVIGTSFLADSSGGFTFTSETSSSVGMTITYTYEVSAIPEPATYAALLGGVVLLGALRRRLRNTGPSPSLPAA